jgi:hypothetical protein
MPRVKTVFNDREYDVNEDEAESLRAQGLLREKAAAPEAKTAPGTADPKKDQQ